VTFQIPNNGAFGRAHRRLSAEDGTTASPQSRPPGTRRGFWSHRGSKLFFESERWADEVHIALAHMDGPLDRSPKAQVFSDTHVDWIELGDGLKRLGGKTGTEPIEPG
jgi:hypothetical protein